jgi:LmbE family N-acetylglucosaminyl deacetylase
MKTILAIAAHGDDEVLGCGGTMARHAAQGDLVHVLLLADGVSSRGGKAGLEERNSASSAAAKTLGATPPILLGLPDNRLDTLALLDIVQKIEPVVKDVDPDIIYTHHGGDLNVDHVLTHRAVLTACRPLPAARLSAIYGFEVLSSTEWASPDQDAAFRPAHHVDISGFLDKKMEALRCYDAEMRPFPHARSYETVKAQAILRGGQVGVPAAEAFTLLRSVWR